MASEMTRAPNAFISAKAYDSVERRAAEHHLACRNIILFDHRVDADLRGEFTTMNIQREDTIKRVLMISR
jgi:hypothetical protein